MILDITAKTHTYTYLHMHINAYSALECLLNCNMNFKKLSWVNKVIIICIVINVLLAIYRYFN